MDHDLSPVTRTLLTRLKHQLRDLITIRLNRPGGVVATLKSEITGELLSAGVAVVDRYAGDYTRPAQDSSEYVYGDILDIDIQRPDMHPDLVAATTRLGVCCGEDSSLYLFQRNNGWSLILTQEANGYEDISGAQGWFDYRISPPDPAGGFFVVTVNVNPWCTSNWQSVRYRVLRPGADPFRLQVLLNEAETIYVGIDPPYTLDADASTFTLKFAAYQDLNPDDFIRPHIVKYRVSTNSVRRIPPLAELPDDFLDEWLDLPWNQAARWADPAALPALKKAHAALHRREGYRASGFLFVRPCPDLNQWQIGLDTSSDADEGAESATAGPQPPVPNRLFFTIEIKNNVFFVQSVSETPPPDCSFSTGLLQTRDDPFVIGPMPQHRPYP